MGGIVLKIILAIVQTIGVVIMVAIAVGTVTIVALTIDAVPILDHQMVAMEIAGIGINI